MPETTAVLHAGLLTALRARLSARDCLEGQRQSPKDFTRQRCLPFVAVVLFLLNWSNVRCRMSWTLFSTWRAAQPSRPRW